MAITHGRNDEFDIGPWTKRSASDVPADKFRWLANRGPKPHPGHMSDATLIEKYGGIDFRYPARDCNGAKIKGVAVFVLKEKP